MTNFNRWLWCARTVATVADENTALSACGGKPRCTITIDYKSDRITADSPALITHQTKTPDWFRFRILSLIISMLIHLLSQKKQSLNHTFLSFLSRQSEMPHIYPPENVEMRLNCLIKLLITYEFRLKYCESACLISRRVLAGLH